MPSSSLNGGKTAFSGTPFSFAFIRTVYHDTALDVIDVTPHTTTEIENAYCRRLTELVALLVEVMRHRERVIEQATELQLSGYSHAAHDLSVVGDDLRQLLIDIEESYCRRLRSP